MGSTLLMISPQTEENSRIFMEEKGLTMELLSDPGNRVAEKYGLAYTYPEDLKQVYLQLGINLEEYNGDASWRLPMPSRYIIDQAGTIRYAHVSADHTVRADPDHTLEELRKLPK
jgi:peroxiredoxin